MGVLIEGINPDSSATIAQLIRALNQFADTLDPWANAVAQFMLADVARRDEAMWRKNSADLAQGVRRELLSAPTGAAFGQLQVAQVKLIKSIPTEAAKRVHALATGQLYNGIRSTELQREIQNTTGVTEARARLIARTETSRAAANLVQARAMYAGSEGYIWRTVKDFDVRPSHAGMEGKYVRWSSPPTLDKLTGHAGCLPNCRCFAEPIFPDY